MEVGALGDKARNSLGSARGEQHSDQTLDETEQFADEKTGHEYDQQTDKAGEHADRRLGRKNGAFGA